MRQQDARAQLHIPHPLLSERFGGDVRGTYNNIYIYIFLILCTMQGIKTAIADRNGIRQNHPPIIQIHYM